MDDEQRIAVLDVDGTEMSYGELGARSRRLAHGISAAGVRPGELVGLCVERSAALVVAAVAIHRAGAAYVAIDPAYPQERVRWMLDDSGAAAVILGGAAVRRPELTGERPAIVITRAGALAGGEPAAAPPLPPPPQDSDLAYVVYTSGSTGRPKGALIDHGGLGNLIDWHRRAFALTAADRCTQIASPGFDAAVWEIWPSLASGATICVVPEALRRDPIELRDWLVGTGITVSFLPTAVAEGVIGLSWPPETALRVLLAGGDALSRHPPAGLPFTVVNNYGPSETTVVATSGPVAPDQAGVPSIGRAIDGVICKVVDEQLTEVRSGTEGELLIGGRGVARGYLGRPELTAERFVERGGQRWYRSGDRVRQRESGEIDFLGRWDDQLSIRGFRVEPGEIVAALNTHPGIETSVVVGRGRTSAERRLVAYVVAGVDPPSGEELAAFLADILPRYMWPATYVWLEALPLTEHGKIDREALPAPLEPAPTTTDGADPRTPIETALVAMMAELLDADEIGMEQDFFMLGGHSMLGAQLIGRLEDQFGVEVSLRYLFDHPTATAIAAEVERQLATPHPESVSAG